MNSDQFRLKIARGDVIRSSSRCITVDLFLALVEPVLGLGRLTLKYDFDHTARDWSFDITKEIEVALEIRRGALYLVILTPRQVDVLSLKPKIVSILTNIYRDPSEFFGLSGVLSKFVEHEKLFWDKLGMIHNLDRAIYDAIHEIDDQVKANHNALRDAFMSFANELLSRYTIKDNVSGSPVGLALDNDWGTLTLVIMTPKEAHANFLKVKITSVLTKLCRELNGPFGMNAILSKFVAFQSTFWEVLAAIPNLDPTLLVAIHEIGDQVKANPQVLKQTFISFANKFYQSTPFELVDPMHMVCRCPFPSSTNQMQE